ncbi:MAG: adenylosuccinate synthase [Clostridiales bacterium]|nr:adenylosuccinate synthase [Clostridiales bacterium]
MNTAIVGINWGDEGKGRMVDLLSEEYDMVVRYQGGNNAGHTVVNPKGKFILNLLPSGILRDEVMSVMGPGMVIDLKHLSNETARLREGGVSITPEKLKISDKAVICLPYNVQQDILEEERLKDKKFGSTRRGIGPVYGDKYMKKTIRMGDLLYTENLMQKVRELVEWKNLLLGSYGAKADAEEIYEWLLCYGGEFKDYICDTGALLLDMEKQGKKIMFEAQLGALRDIDYGIYPYTSSSNTLAAYAPIGSGAPSMKLDKVIGIVKAYSSCVGEGPFVCELFGDEAHFLREAGGEYGAATGRPRRVGGFDAVATAYGVKLQGATEIAITKIDVLSALDKIPVCVAYELDGKVINGFPYPSLLDKCKPVVEYFDGWKQDISGVKSFDELPENAKKYLRYLQSRLEAKITYVSVGAVRDQFFKIEDDSLYK